MLFFAIPQPELLDSLIFDIAEGNKNALGKLYEETQSTVYGFALSILKNQHDAEDALQNTYIAIYDNAHTYRSSKKPLAWIFTITRNLCLMKLRENKKSAPLDVSDYENVTFDDTNHALSLEDKFVLETVLSTLKSDELEIIMMHALGGFKFREIAHLLDLPLSTVLSKYKRSIEKLKILLEERES